MEPVCRSLWSYLTEYSERCPDRRLLGDSRGWLTASQTVRRVRERASLLAFQGIGAGDYTAVCARRDVETAISILALQKLGAVAVLTDPRHSPRAFLDEKDLTIPIRAELCGEAVTIHTLSKAASVQANDPKDPGFMIFTSGTTGCAKAVLLSQYNLVNNLLDSQPLGMYREDDIALGVLPLDHVFGLVLLSGICVLGYGLYFPEKRDPDSILEAVQRERITRMNGVTSLYLSLAERAALYDVTSLRVGFIGGGVCMPDQFADIEDSLGMTLVPVYGMSEFIGIACGSWRDSRELRQQCVGKVYSMNTVKILLEDGRKAENGQEGEICADGPARMLGYFGDKSPRSTMLSTGDLGFLDEQGYLHITGRKKDIIIRNGRNLSPARIEQVLLSIPGVREAAVIGLPDERAGELPWAMVACGAGIDLAGTLSGLLPKNEIPAGFCCVDALPKTHSGKPDKQTIREVLRKWKA